MQGKLRIVLLAVDDEFAGEMQRPLYERHPDWIVGSVISSCEIYKKTKVSGVLFVLRQSGLVFLLEMVRMKIMRAFINRKHRFFPSQLAREHSVETFTSANINDAESIAKLRSWNPDLIISTNFSHYIGKTVRESVASRGCWNLHKSHLPHYRGMAPNFHALREDAGKAGATLHLVTKGFDEGDVLSQVEVPITKTDSVYSLNRKTSEAGGKMLAAYLNGGGFGKVPPTPQPKGDWKNYTYPTRAEISEFRNKGLKFYAPEHDRD